MLLTCLIRYPRFDSSPSSGLSFCHRFFVHSSSVHSFYIAVTNPLAISSTNPHTVPSTHQFGCVLSVHHLLLSPVISFPTSKRTLHNSGLLLLAQSCHSLNLRDSRDSVHPDLFISCNNTNHKMNYSSPGPLLLLNCDKQRKICALLCLLPNCQCVQNGGAD